MDDKRHGMEQRPRGIAGGKAVGIMVFGQLVSLVGTGLTRFALTLWIWDATQKATAVTLMWLFFAGPSVLLGPMAGALVDRWNRKALLLVSDLVAGVMSVALLVLHFTDSLQIWQIYLAGALAGAAESFQQPAQMASITLMVGKDDHARANGMMSAAQFGSAILSPPLAAWLFVAVGLDGVLAIDIGTFLFAVATLLLLRIPSPPRGAEPLGSVWEETRSGFRYVLERPPVLHVIYVFTWGNLLFGLLAGLLSPMILARSGDDAKALGLVMMMQGLGGVVGGVVLGATGGPKRRIHGVLLGMVGSHLFGSMVLGVGQSLSFWMAGAFFTTFFVAFLNGCVMAIGQAKIAPDFQGRVFGLLRTVAQATVPLALAAAGPLADHLFEPGMAEGGALTPVFAGLTGTGAGAGMGVLLLLSGVLGVLGGLGGYLFRTIRDIETILPDQVTDD